MADRRSSDQPTPWRVRNTHNRITRSEDTVPTATIVLAGGSESIVLNHATISQILKIHRAVTATRRVSHETDSSKNSTTTAPIVPQTIRNAKRRGKRQAMAASRKAAAAGESGADTTSTVEDDDGLATPAPHHQDQHGHTTEDEPAAAQDTDVYEEAEAPDAQKQLAPEKDTQAEEEEEQDDEEEEEEEEEAKAVQTEVAEDRLASEEPETDIEIGQETMISFTAGGVEITQDPGAEYDFGHAFGHASGFGHAYKSLTVDGRRAERPPGERGGFIGGQRTWTNAVDQGVAHYAIDAAGQRMAVMVKRKVLPHTTKLQADKTPFSSFTAERRTRTVVTGTRPQKGDNTFR